MDEETLYLQGFAAALADLCRMGHVNLAAQILRANEITLGDLATAKVDESDLVELRHALRAHGDDIH